MYANTPPTLKILDIIRIKRKSMSIKTNNKSCYVLSCRISGESSFFYSSSEIHVKKGDILYIPYGASYSQKCDEEEIICFHLEAYSNMPNKITVFEPQDADTICSLFKRCSEEWESKKPKYQYRCTSVLYEILSYTDFNAPADSNSLAPHFTAADKYLFDHIFDNNLTIADLCKTANISRTYFNNVFKSKYGISPINFINGERIKKAKALLKSGNYTNEEIAYICGFNDVKYFYVVFKKITGCSTREYLKNLSKI